jgi:hypothetical protein
MTITPSTGAAVARIADAEHSSHHGYVDYQKHAQIIDKQPGERNRIQSVRPAGSEHSHKLKQEQAADRGVAGEPDGSKDAPDSSGA